MSEECVPNIGARGRRRRIWLGFVWIGIAAALVAWLLQRHAGAAWSLVTWPAAMMSALYFFQAREKT